MKGGNFFGVMRHRSKVHVISHYRGTLFAALVTQASKDTIKNLENYGKTTKSTGSVLALRVVSFLFGLLTAYILLKREGIFANSA